MTPFRTLLSILAVFLVLGAVSIAFPADGIRIGTFTLRFPSLLSELKEGEAAARDTIDPEEQIQKMLAETRQREFAEYADSLRFYEDFFREGTTRFDFPENDPCWFDRFFSILETAKDSGAVVRIVHYGDSQLEGDRITSAARELFQSLWGGTGPGMLPPLADIPSMAFKNHSTGSLTRHRIFGTEEERAAGNKYGPLAQTTDLRGSATFTFRRNTRAKEFPHAGKFRQVRMLASKANLKTKLIYSAAVQDTVEQDSSLEIRTVTKKFQALPPDIETFPNLSVYTWKLQHETSSATLNVSGNAELYTIALDSTGGIAMDNVAMRGSSGTIFTKMDNSLLGSSLKAVNAKLIIMEYGGNLVPSVSKSNLDWVERILERQIQAVKKAAPNADILFIGPADMSKKINGKWTSFPSLEMTVETIRNVALKNGCAYWDMYRVMGGHNAMLSWVQEKLGGPDYIHFTRAGAARIGELLYSSIKLHYDYFQFRALHGIDSGKLGEIHAFADSTGQAPVPKDTLVAADDTLILTPIQESPTPQDGSKYLQREEGAGVPEASP